MGMDQPSHEPHMGIWPCHIPTIIHYDIFPPGGNLLGNQRIIMNTSIHVDEGIQFSEHRKADNSEEKWQIKKFPTILGNYPEREMDALLLPGLGNGAGWVSTTLANVSNSRFYVSVSSISFLFWRILYISGFRQGWLFPWLYHLKLIHGPLHCVEVDLYSDCKDVTNLIWDSKVKYLISPQKAYLVISLGSAISSSLTVSRKLEVNQPKCWRSASTNNVFQTYVFPQIDMVHTR